MRLFLFASFALALAVLVSPGESTPRVVYGQDTVPGSYIVVLNDDIDSGIAARALGLDFGFESDTIYRRAIKGFAAQMSPEDAQQIAKSDFVKLVAADQYVHTSVHTNPFQTLPTGVDRIDADLSPTANITSDGPNLDIDVAVIDTGVTTGHVDLNLSEGPELPCTGNTTEDGHGHGTHVAGTIAAIDDNHGVTGVAPGARIHPVKVLDDSGNGTNSCVIDGIEWVTNRRQEYNDGAGDGDPGINIIAANMSLGGQSGYSPVTDPMCLAINTAVAAGVIFAVAAGNEGDDSAFYSPAHCTNAITVSAFGDYDGQPGGLSNTTVGFPSCPVGQQNVEDDTFACFSNWGDPVDIAAPGVDILSTYPGPAPACQIVSCYAWMSGTSMAAPHVTGALLILHLEGYDGPATGADVMAALTSAGFTRSQNSDCGFTGDHPNDPAEPVLYMGPLCPDSDHDSFPNTIDNCPSLANIDQANADGDEYGDACEQPQCVTVANHWVVPADDGDCDGFTDVWETFSGTDPAVQCPATATSNDEGLPDTWPADFNDDQIVTGSDALKFSAGFGSSVPGPPYTVRLDLSGDGLITGSDVLKLSPFFGKQCT